MLTERELKRRLGRSLAIASAATMLAVAVPAYAAPSAPASRYASIVIEAETGAVLYERNADLPRHPASLTKMMTLYLTFEALASKKLALPEELAFSAYAVGQDPSRLDLTPGSKLKVEDAIRAMTTKSANDAACAIAERLGKGSESRFAQAMTAKAKALGLKQTTFRNASGLPIEGHLSSARDLALLSKALIHDFPVQYSYFSTGSFDFKGMRYPNQNRFLRTYYGADGIKTGFVNASGHNLAASAVRGGKRLIAIVLGGDTQKWTREHTTRLLDVAYAKIDPSLVMVASNATSPETAPPAPATAAAAAATSATAPVAAYATPAGAVEVASAIPLPNVTANLTAFAAAASAPSAPAGSVPATPPEPSQPRKIQTAAGAAAPPATAPAALVTESVSAPATPSPAVPTKPSHAAPTEKETARALLAHADEPSPAAAATAPRPASAPRAASAPLPAPDAGKPEPAAAAAPAAPQPDTSAAQPGGDWSVQVGLFRDATVARRRGEEARNLMPLPLRSANLIVGRALDGVHVTSRISSLSEQDARTACNELQRGRVPCVVVPPGRPMVVATN